MTRNVQKYILLSGTDGKRFLLTAADSHMYKQIDRQSCFMLLHDVATPAKDLTDGKSREDAGSISDLKYSFYMLTCCCNIYCTMLAVVIEAS